MFSAKRVEKTALPVLPSVHQCRPPKLYKPNIYLYTVHMPTVGILLVVGVTKSATQALVSG